MPALVLRRHPLRAAAACFGPQSRFASLDPATMSGTWLCVACANLGSYRAANRVGRCRPAQPFSRLAPGLGALRPQTSIGESRLGEGTHHFGSQKIKARDARAHAHAGADTSQVPCLVPWADTTRVYTRSHFVRARREYVYAVRDGNQWSASHFG